MRQIHLDEASGPGRRAAGQRIEKIHCASDPDSLDGVIFLDQKRAIIDATAPMWWSRTRPGLMSWW